MFKNTEEKSMAEIELSHTYDAFPPGCWLLVFGDDSALARGVNQAGETWVVPLLPGEWRTAEIGRVDEPMVEEEAPSEFDDELTDEEAQAIRDEINGD